MKISDLSRAVLTAVVAGVIVGSTACATGQVVQPIEPTSYRIPHPWQQAAQTTGTPTEPAPMLSPESAQQLATEPAAGDVYEFEWQCECECEENGLGDPWTLSGSFCEDPWMTVGGWGSMGYSAESDDLFNSNPNAFDLSQGWLYLEKSAARDDGRLGVGFRFDIMYGTDGPDTQAFGNTQDAFGNPRGWDNGAGFTRGGNYGWALPQAYFELAKNDWTVKIGHFYTLIGYEVVTAPDNFFYSHAITMYNSEPFTHTGILGSYSLNDKTELYGGWTAGWDTGFDQFEQGSNFLGGFSYALNDDVDFIYMTAIGDTGFRGGDSYMHSLIFDIDLTCNLNYVAQNDYLRVEDTGEDTFGINQYLFYTWNDRIKLGTRIEWWKGDSITGYAPHGGVIPAGKGSLSYYEWTSGMNFRLNSNIVIRPEYRYDWSPAAQYNQGYFGFDIVATY